MACFGRRSRSLFHTAMLILELYRRRIAGTRKGVTMEDDNRLSYFFLGLGLGVAVGVLFAPKSGEETRTFLRSKAEEGADFVKRKGEDLRESAADVYERGKQRVAR